jgi:DNA-binding XRE family transcriptional regulator
MPDMVVKNYCINKQDFTCLSCYPEIMNEDAKNFARNLQILMQYHDYDQPTLAKKSGVSQKTISNMLNPGDDKSPNLKKVASIAKAFGLQTWHILYPNAPEDILINSSIEKFVENYAYTDKNTREAWAQVAEATTKYNKIKNG